jgi:Cys-rich protein (TIGR01571 family)
MPSRNTESNDTSKQILDEFLDLVEISIENHLSMSGSLSFDEESNTSVDEAVYPISKAQSVGAMTWSTASSSIKMVEVTAPSDLPFGYQFVTQVGRNECIVEVAEAEGVKAGQVFEAVVVKEEKSRLRGQPGHKIPFGHWRDKLFDCFRFGFFHSVVCMACWCSPLLVAQVMTRMGLNIFGQPEDTMSLKSFSITEKHTQTVFYKVSVILLLHFALIETALSVAVMSQIHARDEGSIEKVPTWAYMLLAFRAMCRSTLLLYVLTISARTRRYIKERYGISESKVVAYGMDDTLVSLFCNSCSIAQMARHTADYEKYDALCCSRTGLSKYAPQFSV